MSAYGFLLALAATMCAVWLAVAAPTPSDDAANPASVASAVLRRQGPMPALNGAVGWLNSRPLSAAELRGKVVLVDFWTYSCINWQRTLPYLRAWADKYKDQGLVVVGVHSPEFAFEKDVARVREATSQLDVQYPVAVDNDHAIWRAFGNAYWPALYFVDAKGMIRHRHFGEGDYERSERVIQQLLAEAGASRIPGDLAEVQGSGSQAGADWANLRSPGTYVGHERADGFASPGGMAADRRQLYAVPGNLRLNTWALTGEWTVGGEAATLEQPNGRIAYRFRARDLHLVMGPGARGKPVPFRILVDGKPPGAGHGSDVDADGKGLLVETRLYQLVRQAAPVQERKFEIEFLEPGAEAYSFTFG